MPGREIRSDRKIVLNRHFVLPHRRSAVKPGLAWARSARRARLRHRFGGSSRQAGSPPEAPDRGLRGTIRRTRVRVNPGLTVESTRLYRTAAGIGRVDLPHTSPFANLPAARDPTRPATRPRPPLSLAPAPPASPRKTQNRPFSQSKTPLRKGAASTRNFTSRTRTQPRASEPARGTRPRNPQTARGRTPPRPQPQRRALLYTSKFLNASGTSL